MKWVLSSTRKGRSYLTRHLFSLSAPYSSSSCHQCHASTSYSGHLFSNGAPTRTKPAFLAGLPSYHQSSSSSPVLAYLPYKQQSDSYFLAHRYTTSAAVSSTRVEERVTSSRDGKILDLEIISTESVKPASPTPDHLRTFHFSILDQFFFSCHTPTVLFFPNSDNASVSDVMKFRSKKLKESLAQVLTRFYPFAGEIKDDFHIECNDMGVYFVEARVNQTLSGFLAQPEDQKVKQLIPRHPSATDKSSGNYPLSVQVNVFDCGGIALSTCLTHKIIDGQTFHTFLSAWSAEVKGLSEKISPSFAGSSVFPNNPALVYSLPSKLLTCPELSTRRFVFDSEALTSLKAKALTWSSARGPTRVEAAGAAIWNAAAKAASTVRTFTPQSPHALLSFVNIRKKVSPPLPAESIGSLIVSAVAMCFPDAKPDLPALMGLMRESIEKVDPGFLSAISGEKEYLTVDGLLKMLNDLFDNIDEGDSLMLTSLCNSGLYQIDFGWGKPVWFYYVNPGVPRIVALNDTVKGGGVEAIVSLSPQEMAIFEQDPELRSYTSVDPSPLQFCDL